MPNTDKRNRLKSTVVVAAAIAVLPLASHAAGLGKITVLSALGQPLKAELEVSATADEARSLAAKVAAAEAFRQAGIEYSPALVNLRFSRDIKERGGRRYLEISTDRPLNEPFIDMLVELTWASGRLVREYTFLLDPPDLAARMAPVPIAAPEVRTEPAVARPAEKATTTMPAETRPVIDSPPPASRQPAEKPAERPVAKAAAGGSRTVASGDTLGKIAAQTKPEGVNLDQMLVSLFRSNKEAFDGGNMNRLKAGKILSIPDAEAAGRVSAGEARKEIVAQAVDFNAYRKRLASAVVAGPAMDQGTKQSVSGKIAPKVEDKAPLATGKDKLEVSRTEAARDAKGKPLQGRIATLEEDLVSRDRALKEASSRIVELEKNLSDLKKLAEMKSQTGADLQKQAQATKPAPAEARKPDAPAPAPAVKPAEQAKPAAAPKAAEPPKPSEPSKPVEAPKPAEAVKPSEAPKPPPPQKKAAPPPPPASEPDFVEENAPLVFGGGAVLALLFGWLGISAYRKKRAAAVEANAPIAEADLSAHSVFSTTSVAPPPSEQEPSQFSSTGMGVSAHQETVDPVVEADTFLAFGRDAQAEEILLEALKADPQRQAIHLKLLDTYAARKNVSRFESVAKELHALTGGAGAGWEKAAAMGAALDPGNSLYGSMPSEVQATAAAAAFDMEATTILRASPIDEKQAPGAAVVPEAGEAAALDFDLDMGAPEAASPAAAAPVAEPAALGLDFDLDLGAPEATPSPEAVPQAEARREAGALDIEFDMPAKESSAPVLDFPLAEEKPAPAPEAPAAAAADSGGIDFDFDLGTPDSAAPVPVPEMSLELPASAATPAPAPIGIDLGDISLELDTPAVSASTAPEPAAAEMHDNPEVATKIELAMAYEEMGDRDGARELFQEALAEGSPAQQEVARAKLDSLG
ncbi:MAG: FimV/HubP family polar landmark protein [Sulfuritalea sp.]|nr:FimV/HubP family polar landmark protein [Sulfuritalea sp.]